VREAEAAGVQSDACDPQAAAARKAKQAAARKARRVTESDSEGDEGDAAEPVPSQQSNGEKSQRKNIKTILRDSDYSAIYKQVGGPTARSTSRWVALQRDLQAGGWPYSDVQVANRSIGVWHGAAENGP
jgi:hypothetical protein